jgi:TRAP-type C4-dicarboxylate transport system permease small subunit
MAFHKLLEKGGALYDRIMNLFAFLAALVVASLVGVLCYEVFMRYVIHKPPAWAWEVAESILCLIAFLSAAWLLREDGHVSVDIVHSHLSPRLKILSSIVTSALGMIICLIIGWAGVGITIDHFHAGITVPGYLDIPKAPLLLFIPIGCFMLSIQFLRQTFNHLKKWRNRTKGDTHS